MIDYRQFALPFPHDIGYDPSGFLRGDSNAIALSWLNRMDVWPASRLAIQGEAGVGKTHLLHVFAHRYGAALLRAEAVSRLMPIPEATSLAIDDADMIRDSSALLHFINIAAECGKFVLMAGRTVPVNWCSDLPDLSSRLRSMSMIKIDTPDESMLRALLHRFLSERQLDVSQRLQDFLLSRLPRTGASLREAAARLDRLSLARGRNVTFAMAACVTDALQLSIPDRPPTERGRLYPADSYET